MDAEKELSCHTIHKQLTNCSDLLGTLDFAPPTKKTMMWKEWGGVDKLLYQASQPMLNAQLQKVKISSLWGLCHCVGSRIVAELGSDWERFCRFNVILTWSWLLVCTEHCPAHIALPHRAAGHLMVCTPDGLHTHHWLLHHLWGHGLHLLHSSKWKMTKATWELMFHFTHWHLTDLILRHNFLHFYPFLLYFLLCCIVAWFVSSS